MDEKPPSDVFEENSRGYIVSEPNRKPLSFFLTLSLPAVSFLALLSGAIWYGALSRDEAVRDAQVQAVIYRDAFAAHTQRTFDVTRLVLHQISNELNRSTSANWRTDVTSEHVSQLMRDQLETVPHLIAIMVLDRDGQIVSCAGPEDISSLDPPPKLQLLNNNDHESAQIKIGSPIRDHPCLGKDVVLPVFNEIFDASGQKVGMVVGAVDPAYYSKFFAALTQGAKSTMGLIHIEGPLLSREPYKPNVIGVSAHKSKIYSSYLAGNNSGLRRATSPVDGTERIGAYVKLDGIPVLAYVATAVDDALIPWRENLREWVPIVSAVLVIVLVLGGMSLMVATQREKLALALAKRGKALAKAKEEAENANKMKSDFLSVVSHELRTPLTSIKGSLGLLSGHLLKDIEKDAQTMLDMAVVNTDRLVFLVNDILDMEKFMSGKIDLHLDDFALQDLVTKTIDQNQGYAQEYNIQFNLVSAPQDVIIVHGDFFKLGQVLANLISNAAKFSFDGGRVEISISTHGDKARVSITDFGCGIPKEFHDHIFAKFAQVDMQDNRSRPGTGLGLSISKAIMDCHHGHIGFTSKPGSGSTFFFELKMVDVSSEGRKLETKDDHRERCPTPILRD